MFPSLSVRKNLVLAPGFTIFEEPKSASRTSREALVLVLFKIVEAPRSASRDDVLAASKMVLFAKACCSSHGCS